jgi:hypothetical protein
MNKKQITGNFIHCHPIYGAEKKPKHVGFILKKCVKTLKLIPRLIPHYKHQSPAFDYILVTDVIFQIRFTI